MLLLTGIESRSSRLPSSSVSYDPDDDFGLIPNQSSLRRGPETDLLKNSALGLGDPCSAYGTDGITKKNREDAISDFENSETFQNIQQAAKIVMKSKLAQNKQK